MFNLQGSEIIIILLLALVVLGPEKLPDAMRKMGQFYAELRKMSSGFQQEFRSAVDEPMREIRDTANTLRDSADFTKLQAGDRAEKPKSAEMAPAGDPVDDPVEQIPDFEPSPDATDHEPELADDSKPAPFSQNSSAAPRPSTEPTPVPAPPAPFTGMSSAAPRPDDTVSDDDSTQPTEPTGAAAADGGSPESEGSADDRPNGDVERVDPGDPADPGDPSEGVEPADEAPSRPAT